MEILKQNQLDEAVEYLKQGKTLVFPTETSYGLGCDATNQGAVNKIFSIKQRRSGKPLLVVVPTVEMAKKYLLWNNTIDNLANQFWPGPLTVIGGCLAPPPFKEGIEGWSRKIGHRLLGHIRTIGFRSELRKNKTKAEMILWSQLRNKRLGGLRFRRQHGIGPFIVDFYHSESKTGVEIDGDIHFVEDKNITKDNQRTKWLEYYGYKVMRFNNVDIFNNLENILQHIYYNIISLTGDETPPHPPLERGGGESLFPSFQGGGRGVVSRLANGVVAADNTIAVRVTGHPVLKFLAEKLGRPVVATSANISGAGDVYSALDAAKMFEVEKNQPDFILDYGTLPKNLPSTIVSAVNDELKIIRQGELKI